MVELKSVVKGLVALGECFPQSVDKGFVRVEVCEDFSEGLFRAHFVNPIFRHRICDCGLSQLSHGALRLKSNCGADRITVVIKRLQ